VSDPVKLPVYALCGSGYWTNSRLPFRGRAVAKDWDPDPAAEGGLRGLAWGKGDPAAAFLDHGNWAVVRIEDPAEPVQIPGAVKFREGTVLYNGNRRGALEALLLCGADPAAMTIRLVTPGLNGIAEAGPGGVAISGYAGLARAGDGGEAFAGREGLAVAGSNGTASVDDEFGIAFSGPRGTAVVGYQGIAVVREHGGEATAGELGVAVALGRASAVAAGEDGQAVALGSSRSIRIGARGIAVGLDFVEGRNCIQAASNALVVLRIRDGETYRFVVAVAGEEGFSADRPLCCWDGEWIDPSDVPASAASAPAPATKEPAAEDGTSLISRLECFSDPPIDKDVIDFIRSDLGEDIFVLCALPWDARDKQRGETIHASDWDPAPESDTGYFGLPWGEGDAVVGRLNYKEWMIVRAAVVRPVLSGGVQAAVRFESGEIVFSGSPGRVLEVLLTLGVDRAHLSGRLTLAGDRDIAQVGDSAVAVVGRSGWALAGNYAEAIAGSDGIARAYSSYAEVGPHGIAITDEEGYSKAGAGGVAISLGKRYGEAEAGDGGLAIGRGRFKILWAGRGGAAIGMDHGAHVAVYDGGVAIGDNHTRAGRNGVAIALGGTVSGGPGCLLVQRWRDGARIRYATGVAGERGILPDVNYGVHEGKLCREENIPKPISEPAFDFFPDRDVTD
jgi:hypothetical protein